MKPYPSGDPAEAIGVRIHELDDAENPTRSGTVIFADLDGVDVLYDDGDVGRIEWDDD